MWIGQGSFITGNTTVHFINNTAKGVGGAIYDSYSQPNNNNYVIFPSDMICTYTSNLHTNF